MIAYIYSGAAVHEDALVQDDAAALLQRQSETEALNVSAESCGRCSYTVARIRTLDCQMPLNIDTRQECACAAKSFGVIHMAFTKEAEWPEAICVWAPGNINY